MSNTRATKLPSIPANAGEETVDAIREILEVWANRVGDPLDSVVTVRMLRDGGIADVAFLGLSGGARVPRGSIGGPGSPIFLNPTPPGTNPIPSGHLNVRVEAIWDGIMVKWDWPPGNIEYSATEIWAAKQVDPLVIPTFEQALLVGTSAGASFAHLNLGLGAVWYYWIRYVGFAPSGGGEPPYSAFTPGEGGRGIRGETAVDPAYVLGVLSGQIGEDQLAIGLGNRIDLVDFYYDPAGNRVPVPTVDVVDADGNLVPGRPPVQNVRNQVLAAVRDVNSDFQIAIAEEAAIRQLDDDTIAASYGVRADIDGYVVGFGFIGTRTDPGDPLVPPEFDSAFVVRANRFAVVFPDELGAEPGIPVVPFIVGTVDGVPTVGINGAVVVDGTITARHIQAESIGAAQVNAAEVWAAIVTADRIFASSFATSGDLNWRVEIGGVDQEIPFWYGQGVKGGQNSVFYFDNEGNTWLAGNLTVTGAGRFSTAAGEEDARVELGGSDGNALWVGSGERTNDNAKLRFDTEGNIFIRGLPLSIPIASGSGSASITVVPRSGSNTAPVLALGTGVVRELGSEDDGKAYTVELLIGNTVAAAYRCESMDEESLPVPIMGIVEVPAGTHQITMRLTDVDYGGGGGGLRLEQINISAFQAQIADG